MRVSKNDTKQRLCGGVIAFAAILFVSCFFTAMIHHSAAAANTVVTTPSTINFQGRLTDSTGAAVADGQYNITFRLINAATGGTTVWTEARETTNRITVTNGLFSVQLGAVTPITPDVIAAQSNLWLEVELPTPATATCSTAGCASYTVGPLTPRSKLASSAYAMNADLLDGLDSSSFAKLTGNNTFTGTATFTNLVQLKPTVGNDGTVFDVQNSGGSDIFAVNTSASVVRIGSATADATGVVLVLDSKNTAGDPTGYNGAMYYNSSTNRFRCYQGNVWVDCVSRQTPAVKTGSYTAKDGDFVIGDASAGGFTVTLPAPTPGARISVKKVDSSSNAITVTPTTGKIDNLTSDIITTQWYSQDYYSDGATWYRV